MQALSKIQPPFALPAGGGRSRLAPPSSTPYTIKSGATGAGNEGWTHVQQGQQPSLRPGMEYSTFVNQQAGSSSSSRAVATGRVPDSTSRTIRSSSSSTSSQSSSPPFSRNPSTNSTPMSSKAPTPNSSTRALELSMAPFDMKPKALPNSGQQQDSIEEEWEVIYPDD
jgi:hypothetical protein